MAGLIAGKYASRGEGIALLLSRVVTGAPHDEVVVSQSIRGPFLVVSVWLYEQQGGAHSAELSVVSAGASGSLAFGQGLTLGGYRLMEAGQRQVRDGAPTLAEAYGLTNDALTGRRRGATYFPWYLYTGESGAIALVVRRHDLVGVVCAWNAGVTIWPLDEVGNPNGGNGNGRHRSSRAAWRVGGGPGRGLRAPLAFAVGGAKPGGDVGGVPGRAR